LLGTVRPSQGHTTSPACQDDAVRCGRVTRRRGRACGTRRPWFASDSVGTASLPDGEEVAVPDPQGSIELTFDDGRIRIWRSHDLDVGVGICKEALGPGAPDRIAHEISILGRLDGVPGVPRLRHAPDPHALVFVDRDGRVLAARQRGGPVEGESEGCSEPRWAGGSPLPVGTSTPRGSSSLPATPPRREWPPARGHAESRTAMALSAQAAPRPRLSIREVSNAMTSPAPTWWRTSAASRSTALPATGAGLRGQLRGGHTAVGFLLEEEEHDGTFGQTRRTKLRPHTHLRRRRTERPECLTQRRVSSWLGRTARSSSTGTAEASHERRRG